MALERACAVCLVLALLLALAPIETARAGDVPILLAQAQPERPNLLRSLFGADRPRQAVQPERRTYRAVRPQKQKVRPSQGGSVRKRPPRRQVKKAEQAPARRVREDRTPRRQAVPKESIAAAPASGTFRTLCVRTCDGYYFPISFSTTQDRFGDDQKACKALCPGTDVALYYHDVALSAAPDGDADAAVAMMSLAGETYEELPAAFSYRERLDAGCACGGPGGPKPLQDGAAAPAETAAQDPSGFAPAPAPRPDPSEDPETLANREGAFVARGFGGAPLASIDPQGGRNVRVVWPAYGLDPGKGPAVLRQVSR